MLHGRAPIILWGRRRFFSKFSRLFFEIYFQYAWTYIYSISVSLYACTHPHWKFLTSSPINLYHWQARCLVRLQACGAIKVTAMHIVQVRRTEYYYCMYSPKTGSRVQSTRVCSDDRICQSKTVYAVLDTSFVNFRFANVVQSGMQSSSPKYVTILPSTERQYEMSWKPQYLVVSWWEKIRFLALKPGICERGGEYGGKDYRGACFAE